MVESTRRTGAVVIFLLLGSLASVPTSAHASCNLIPQTVKTYNSTMGATDRPFAAPGEAVEVRARPCDSDSIGLDALPANNLVTVIFTPTDPGAPRNAVILTSAADCSAITAPELAACEADLGPGSTATCVASAAAGVQVVERDSRSLRFTFPDTDAFIGGGADDVTLAGPVKIAVSDPSDPLPCTLATQTCNAQSGLRACIDQYYAGTGGCGEGSPLATFPGFTALPPPNDYSTACFTSDPPCDASATAVRSALDANGNLLTAFKWSAVLLRDFGVPVPRTIGALLRSPISIDDPIYLGSYTPEGGELEPVFEPQRDSSIGASNLTSLFGSADAPYTVLRIARNSGTCSGGPRAGLDCSNNLDCKGATCVSDGENFDLSQAPELPNGGPIIGPRFTDNVTTEGLCQDNQPAICAANADCSAGPCTTYAYEAQFPVPLEGLAASDVTRSYSIRETIDGVDRNGDGDVNDTVVVLRDRATGALTDLGVPVLPGGCSLSGGSGRGIVRIFDPPHSYPAIEIEDDITAFLESEPYQDDCDLNQNTAVFDSVLRVADLESGDLTSSITETVDAAPVIDSRSLAVNNGQVFFRLSEPERTVRKTERVSVDGLTEGNGLSSGTIGLSDDLRYVTFTSRANNLVVGDTNHMFTSGDDVFVHDRDTGDIERVSVHTSGAEANGPSFVGGMSADATQVVFSSTASNLPADGNGTVGDAFVRDRDTDTTVLVSVNTAGTQHNGDGVFNPTISADGSVVAFISSADNLVAGDLLDTDDVFVRDRDTDNDGIFDEPGFVLTERLTVFDGFTSESTISLSADGRYVAFVTGDLITSEVWVYDRDLDTYQRVSVDNAGNSGNNSSHSPSISRDGRYVAFTSLASNLVPNDSNGLTDVFVHDRIARVTERVNVSSSGVQGNGGGSFPSISADGRYVAFSDGSSNLVANDAGGTDVFVHDRVTGATHMVSRSTSGTQANAISIGPKISASGTHTAFLSEGSNLVGGDGNGVRDVFLHGYDRDNASEDITGDGDAHDTVLGMYDTTQMSPSVVPLCPATQVSVAAGKAAFLRPESEGNTPDLADCPAGTPDGDGVRLNAGVTIDDEVVHLAFSATNIDNLDLAATAVSLSSTHLAALVSEAGEGNQNGDGDTSDDVVQIHPAGAGAWTNTQQAADDLKMVGSHAVFITPESAQGNAGGTDLNVDGDKLDRVLQVYNSAGSAVTCSPQAGATCTTGVRRPAEEFVVGELTQTICGPRRLVAFRTSERAQNNTDLNGDGDPINGADPNYDEVLQVFDLQTGELQNTGLAVLPCRIPECDPLAPYKVEGSKVRFLTLEADQGNQDLTGDLVLGVALQLYDFCNDVNTTIGQVVVSDADANPLASIDGGVAYVAQAQRCLLNAPSPCLPANDLCGQGASCVESTCTSSVCAGYGGACATNADCARCVVHQPGTCTNNVDCATGSLCKAAYVVAVTSVEDADEDGVPDEQDNCPDVVNTDQEDADQDGVGDLCDLQTCGNGSVEQPAEACDDGNLSNGDGCEDDCRITGCGNGAINGLEDCDDGNAVDGDGCDNNCTVTGCGNGVLTGTEQCDDGNAVDDDACSNSMHTRPSAATVSPRAPEECDDGNQIDGDGCTRQCRTTTSEVEKCQATLGSAADKYMSGRLKALHSCRKALNTGKPRYFDKEKTMPLTDPSQCTSDYKAAGKIAKTAASMRKLVEKKCTNTDLEALSACDITVNAVISVDGTTGCLPATAIAASNALIDAQYGRELISSESGENACQAAVASAGSAYATSRSKALRGCRNGLNKGTALFTDEAETMPVTDPAQCASEVDTAADITKAGDTLRSKVADACTDPLVSSLSSTCASTVDGLVNVSGTGGCLVSSGNSAVAALIDTAY